jgi:hypothetical protein
MKIPIPIILDMLMEVALRTPSSRRNWVCGELCSTTRVGLSGGLFNCLFHLLGMTNKFQHQIEPSRGLCSANSLIASEAGLTRQYRDPLLAGRLSIVAFRISSHVFGTASTG